MPKSGSFREHLILQCGSHDCCEELSLLFYICSYGVKANLVVDDIAEVISELKLFKQAGGGTLCDISPFGVRSVLSFYDRYILHDCTMKLTYREIFTTNWQCTDIRFLFCYRLKREELPRISRETGLHIIAGTAFYVDPLIPEEVKLMTIEEVG